MIIYILSQLVFKVKQIKSQLSTRLYDFTKTLRFRYRNILFSFFRISYNKRKPRNLRGFLFVVLKIKVF